MILIFASITIVASIAIVGGIDLYLYSKYAFYEGWRNERTWWNTLLGSGYIFWYKHIRGKNV